MNSEIMYVLVENIGSKSNPNENKTQHCFDMSSKMEERGAYKFCYKPTSSTALSDGHMLNPPLILSDMYRKNVQNRLSFTRIYNGDARIETKW